MQVDEFDYELPDGAIAQEPIEPRDASRLLLASDLEEIPFRAFPTLLDEGDLVVVNDTRVRAARLMTTRSDTGGVVEVLLTQRRTDSSWEALIRPARRIRRGITLELGERAIEVVSDPERGVAVVEIAPANDIEAFLDAHGTVPLPPYFHGRLSDPERYQTMFATTVGSSAAPTASLHFTPAVVEGLAERGVGIASVNLEVGLDTFRPMTTSLVADHVIHSERIGVSGETAEAVNRTHTAGRRVVAIGTTVVRTLESAADDQGRIQAFDGRTDLFITPGYRPRAIDAVVTNFHAPRTTLIVMIAALLGDRWRSAYEHALASGFRFLSFGDAMFFEVIR
jgi:S-adenosylmethionine:tRNA ribosyltransferase-isomerase